MIRNSFIFLDRVGKKKEQRIWEQGIHTWQEFIDAPKINGISKRSKTYHCRKIKQFSKALYSLDSAFFSRMLPQKEHWRVYRFFRDEAVFLDIETSGVEKFDDVTVIGLFDGINTKIMIRGINLDFSAIAKELSHYKILVTFNGSSFDLPFLKKRYPRVIPSVPHIDIRHLCQNAGHTGGLKEIEKKMGIRRSRIIERFYGGDPYRLWRMYRASGEKYYLDLLVEYNEDDVINLKTVADKAIEEVEAGFKERFSP